MPEHASRLDTALYDQFEDDHPVADWGGDDLFTRMPRPRAVDDAPAPRFRPYLAAAEPTRGESDSAARRSTSAARASASAARASRPSGPAKNSSGSATRSSGPAASTSGSATRSSGPATNSSGSASRPPGLVTNSSGSASRPPGSTATPPDGARRAPELALVAPMPDPAEADALSLRERRLAAGIAERAMLERAERLGLSVVELPHEPVHRWDESGAMIEPPPGRETRVITGHPGGPPRPLPTVRTERRRPSRTPAEWIGSRPERIVAWAFALGLLLILIAISTADAATL